MKTVWFAAKNGSQYWLRLNSTRSVFEFSCRPGKSGGEEFNYDIYPSSLKNKIIMTEIIKAFGQDEFSLIEKSVTEYYLAK